MFELSYEDGDPYPASGAGFSAELERPLTEQLATGGLSPAAGVRARRRMTFFEAMRPLGRERCLAALCDLLFCAGLCFALFAFGLGPAAAGASGSSCWPARAALGNSWAYSLAV